MRIYPVKLQSNISSGAYLSGHDLNGDDKKNIDEFLIELRGFNELFAETLFV